MNLKIVEIQEIALKGISKKLSGKAANRFYQEHIMWADHHDDIQNAVSTNIPGTWYGIWDNGIYWIARAASDVESDKLEDISIPGGTYAVFESEFGNHAGDELPKLRDYIFDECLPKSEYRQRKDYEVEVYHLYPSSEKEKRHYEIWVPVEKI